MNMGAGKTEQQCRMIAGHIKGGGVPGIVVDNDEKADRFIRRIKELCPGADVVKRGQFHGAVFFSMKLTGAKPANN